MLLVVVGDNFIPGIRELFHPDDAKAHVPLDRFDIHNKMLP